MSPDSSTRHPSGFPRGSLSDAKIEELNRIRESILANARHSIDLDGTGFDAMMMASDDTSFFRPTDDWLDWWERFINVLSLASQRLSLAVLSVGFAVSGSNMLGAEGGWGLARTSLAVAAGFGVWAAVMNLRGPRGGR